MSQSKTGVSQTTTLLDTDAAAAYAKMSLVDFRKSLRRGAGPVYVLISPKVKMFEVKALDQWIAGWRTIPPMGVDHYQKRK
jgi:hypothetical protein